MDGNRPLIETEKFSRAVARVVYKLIMVDLHANSQSDEDVAARLDRLIESLEAGGFLVAAAFMRSAAIAWAKGYTLDDWRDGQTPAQRATSGLANRLRHRD